MSHFVRRNPLEFIKKIARGVCLCLGITALAKILEIAEASLFGRAWIEALVLAILIGVAVRSIWTPDKKWMAGISFSAKMLLEIAVVLLGLSISFRMIADAGVRLFIGIVVVVVATIAASYSVSRLLGLHKRLALLVACGNSICGNSAIAAVAPVIGADGEDVASSIAFTAVLGVVVVLTLPFLVPLLNLSPTQYGTIAGLTVYAVPQVLAATMPVGTVAVQMGTLVKLVRVLMLGPVILALSLITSRWREEPDEAAPHITAGDRPKPGFPPIHHLVPWFIVGFLGMIVLRSFDYVPHAFLAPLATVTSLFTTISMAALGLGVDIRVVASSGGRVTAAAAISLFILGSVSLGLIYLLGVE